MPSTPGWAVLACAAVAAAAQTRDWDLEITQLTQGPQHHFFGYIGHVGTIPWSADGRYIIALRTRFQDHMPKPAEAAEIVLIDTRPPHRVVAVETTRAWNFQQGTMLYWNPLAPTQFFFNDRDLATNQVFTVLYDIAARRRIREFRYPSTPFANGGVAQTGGFFAGLNYGRMARLRPVTGYPGAFDWNPAAAAPANDGLFLANTVTGESRLLVSFARLVDALRQRWPGIEGKHLFLNHSLWNRDGTRIFFFVRGDFDRRDRVDIPCTIHPDGTNLLPLGRHIGGHPEWEYGTRMIGSLDGRMVLYDTDRNEVTGTIGTREIFPDPGGDTALSPDGNWIVNGYREREANFYVVYRRSDSTWVRSAGFPHRGWTSGELRVDAAPCWNRTSDQIVFPAIAQDPGRTRQLFLISIRPAGIGRERRGAEAIRQRISIRAGDAPHPARVLQNQ